MGKYFFDAVIVGGGHNGLVCSYYLAKAGLKVKILERRNIVGGAAVTEEFHPGFKNSTASYTVSLLNPDVIKDMHLKENGLEIIKRPISNFLPVNDKDYIKRLIKETKWNSGMIRKYPLINDKRKLKFTLLPFF